MVFFDSFDSSIIDKGKYDLRLIEWVKSDIEQFKLETRKC